MIELFFSELRRFRNAAIIYFFASLVLVTVANQLVDLGAAQFEIHMMLLLLYALSGAGLGLYQFGTYRQPSRWIWLQHRPLHRARILAGIAAASGLLIALAMALPLLIVLGLQDHFTQRIVDERHYAGVAFLALSTLSAWLAGAYIMLHRSRWAFVILVLPIVLTMHFASYGIMLALALACNALLLFLVYTVFRPNRYTGDDAAATVASSVPLQLGFYFALLWAGSMLFQVGQMLAGVHPLSAEHVVAGGLVQAQRFDAREALLAGLEGVQDPRAAAWRAGIQRNNTVLIRPRARGYAVRDLATNLGMSQFQDEHQNAWIFSHDRMGYRGVNRRTGVAAGWFGAGGRTDKSPFDTQPAPLESRGRQFLATAHELYELDKSDMRLRHLLHAEGAEQVGPAVGSFGPRTILLTNRRVLLVDEVDGQIKPLASLPLPFGYRDLERTYVAQVADGTLVSFISGNRRYDGVGQAQQVTYLLDAGGRASELSRRELAHDFPALFEHKDWWVSPVLHAVVSLPDILIEKGVVADYGANRFAPLLWTRPSSVWTAAIVLVLASLLGAAWWTGRAGLSPRARLAWCLGCLLVGVPALLSLMVLQPRAAREELAAGAAAKAAA